MQGILRHLPIQFNIKIGLSLIGVWLILHFILIGLGSQHLELYISKIFLIVLIAYLFVSHRQLFKNYIDSIGSGFNLAIFRIVFFSFMVIGFFVKGPAFLAHQVMQALEAPDSITTGMTWSRMLFKSIPTNQILIHGIIVTFISSAVFALVGLYTRVALFMFVISASYLFGLPQMFGKINHNHHLIWFPTVLIFSGCGDFISMDRLLKKLKGKIVRTEIQTKDYGMALHGIGLLIAIIYFFPGFYKIWQNGLQWVFSDTLINHVRIKMIEQPGWEPFFPIYNMPYVSQIISLLAVTFEIAFPFLIIHPKYRLIGILAGFCFHIGTWLFLNIFFVVLLLSYVIFIDWHSFFKSTVNTTQFIDTAKNKPLTLTIGVLLSMNILFGAFNLHAWPFSIYPTFSEPTNNFYESTKWYQLIDHDFVPIKREELSKVLSPEKLMAIEKNIIHFYKINNNQSLQEIIQHVCKKLNLHASIKINMVYHTWHYANYQEKESDQPLFESNITQPKL